MRRTTVIRDSRSLAKLREVETVTTESGRVYRVPGSHSDPVTGLYSYHSITTILGNDPAKRRALAEWRARVGVAEAAARSKRASTRGSAVHSVMEKYVLGEDYEEPTNPVRARAFRNLRDLIDCNLEEYHAVEAPLWSHLLETAGRCDLVGRWNGRLAVIDYKTADHEKDEAHVLDYFLQSTAYAIMFEERTGIPVPGVVVLIACDSGVAQAFARPKSRYVRPLIEALEQRRPR